MKKIIKMKLRDLYRSLSIQGCVAICFTILSRAVDKELLQPLDWIFSLIAVGSLVLGLETISRIFKLERRLSRMEEQN